MNSKNPLISKSSPIRVGITIGDPSGIGPAVTGKAVSMLKGLAGFVIIGDRWVFDKIQNSATKIGGLASHFGEPKPQIQNFEFIDLNNVNRKGFQFGKVRAEYGRASVDYLDKALELIEEKEIDCLVTCPVSKESINRAGLCFTGHTEYLAKRTETSDFVMMLLNKKLKFSLVTRHVPLMQVGQQIAKDKIHKTVLLTHKSLRELFSIKNPRIVVCGLNPHASDNGLIGNDENNIIRPVLRRLRRKIRGIDGPLPADVAILKAHQKEYDCVIAMYHDQALIPLKLSGGLSGVNLTLGLPFIRTSPLHGTAFDIAGDFALADPASLVEAIKLAVECTSNLRRV